ncbi:MAG: N-acetylneuraminate synthase family protein [bacterium]|nr:N-acetylneuraminate synthase family protein [bacterium]
MDKTIVIAEIGENHIGNMEIAKKLIKDAAQAGADFAKFQSYLPENFGNDDPEYEWFKKVSLTDDQHRELQSYAKECGIQFMSAPFSLERAKFLCEGLGLKAVKVASGMMLNFSVLDYINWHAQTVFLSTGMATMSEIKDALSHLTDVERVYVLHCVTQYPCADEDANILAIQTLKDELADYRIGYSDHTEGYLAPLAACALGAEVIEKHFTFDKKAKEGTDHMLSVEPEELKGMIAHIRRIEQMRGTGVKKPGSGEEQIKTFVRNRFKESK